MARSWIRTYWDEFVAYGLAFAGAVLSGSLGDFKSSAAIEIDLSTGRLIIAALLALAVTLVQEFIPPLLGEEDKVRTKAGKRRHLAKRFFLAIVFGFAATQFVDVAMNFVPRLGG